MSPRSRTLAALLLLTLLTLAGYGRILRVGFVSDDFYSLYGQKAFSLGHLFTSNLLGRQGAGGFYRPCSFLGWKLDYALYGLDATKYNRLNLILYIAVVLCVFRLGQRLGRRALCGWIAAALFALHPSHVEAVAWISSRVELGCALFYLLAVLLCAPLGDLPPPRRTRLALGMAAFLIALLHKEMAFTLPGIFLLADFLRPAAAQRGRGLAWRLHLLTFGLLLAFLAWRAHVLGGLAAGYGAKHFRFGSMLSGSVVGGNLAFYCDWLLQPLGLPWLSVGIGNRAPLLLLAILAAAIALLWVQGVRLTRRAAFALLWIPVCLTPVLTLSRPQYLFLPSVGFCLLLAFGLVALLERLRRWAFAQGLVAAGLALLLLAYGSATVRGMEVWVDASEQVQQFLRLLKTAYPRLPPAARCAFIGLPVNVGAPVFQNGIEPALRMYYDDFTLQAQRVSDFGDAHFETGGGALLLFQYRDQRYLDLRSWRGLSADRSAWQTVIAPEQPVDLAPESPDWAAAVAPGAPATELALVSSIHNGRAIGQESVVAQLTLLDGGGRRLDLPIRAGVETCEWSIGRPDQSPADHLALPPVVSWLEPLPDGRAFTGRHVLARFPLPEKFVPVRIEARFVWHGPPAARAYLKIAELALEVQP
jgi:hypothetical protein